MADDGSWVKWALLAVIAGVFLYLFRVNQQLSGTPDEVRRLSGPRWTPELLRETYERLERDPIDYTDRLPPRLDRRYIVTGGSGLVGGHIVQQLLARGTPPSHIRILDIRRLERPGLLSRGVDFAHTNITSLTSVSAAFSRPWPSSCCHLPLTVFHTAAVIIASDRSSHTYAFPERVNVAGTANVLAAAKEAGASVFSATSSASIAIRSVGAWTAPWESEPRGFFQVLDTRDFALPVRSRGEFFGNYPATKALAEKLVCDADEEGFRTGAIRPANGVYGDPTDNTVGDPLAREVMPTWVSHIVQSFVHAANVAVAHLHHEAALVQQDTSSSPTHSGRPFIVTDPNPPITYGDIYLAIATLTRHRFVVVNLPPVLLLVVSHVFEIYCEVVHFLSSYTTTPSSSSLLSWLAKLAKKILPPLRGDLQHLKPGLFSITTHVVGSNAEIGKPVSEGGLGYAGLLTTLEGVVGEVLEWNREHEVRQASEDELVDEAGGEGEKGGKVVVVKTKKRYTTSVSLAAEIEKLALVGHHQVQFES
ncbi:NAD(P)-binding protein [Xylariaceae sp. FL0594]|nr:NAD(P)-binding protein [Xylariaceae sp. FL0594]